MFPITLELHIYMSYIHTYSNGEARRIGDPEMSQATKAKTWENVADFNASMQQSSSGGGVYSMTSQTKHM